MSVSQFTSVSGILLDGVLINAGSVDINGTAAGLILDADGDTHLGASTDDQIDVTINGAQDFKFTSNSFVVLSGSNIAGPSSTFATFIPVTAQQNITGAGAISVSTYFTAITTTAGNAYTLADAAIKGQLKKIYLAVDSGDATITPSNLSGGTTIVLGDVGDYVLLVWGGNSWIVLENSGTAVA